MTAGSTPDEPAPAPHPSLAGEWQLDAEPILEIEPEPETSEPPNENQVPTPTARPNSGLFPNKTGPTETPPSPEQIIEAMLFVGGHPLTATAACSAVRGLTPDGFTAAIDTLSRRYRRQRRPYEVLPREGGFVLSITSGYRGLRERLFGGPREARLNQPALDVLSVVAYRQPIGKAEVDAVRGTDSSAILRQLVRLGLVAVQHRADSGSKEVRYGTTPRFLQVFGIGSLEELPRLGDTTQV